MVCPVRMSLYTGQNNYVFINIHVRVYYTVTLLARGNKPFSAPAESDRVMRIRKPSVSIQGNTY